MTELPPSPKILQDVKYQIQNVDFGTVLERRDKGALVMRPMKEGSLKQQWYFTNTGDVYQINNAYDRSSVMNGKLETNAIHPVVEPNGNNNSESKSNGSLTCAKASSATGKQWKLAVDLVDHHNVYIVSESLGDENVLVYVQTDGSPRVQQDTTILDFKKMCKGEEYQWKIVEVTPASLPDGDGKYRIRTLNGMAIHTEPGNKLSIKNQERGDHRAWEIKSKGNGKCTILNIQFNTFLTADKNKDGEWIPSLSKNEELWDVQSTSDFTYSICVKRPIVVNKTTVDAFLSLSLKDKTIILKPMKNAHNQIWCIELTDAALDIPNNSDEGDEGLTNVLPGLPPKDYFLRYGGISGYYVCCSSNNAEVFAGSDDDKADIKLECQEEGQSGKAFLSWYFDGNTRYLAFKGNELSLDNSKFPWIVEKSGHYYYICSGRRQEQFLGGPSAVNGKLTAQSKGASNTLWEFVPT